MKTTGAICWEPGTRCGWSVEEIEIDPPKPEEVLVKLAASGICHSDDHLDSPVFHDVGPMVGGHEGAGIVQEVGSKVSSVKPGDHVVLSFIPSCGRCYDCIIGNAHLCEKGQYLLAGVELADQTARIHARGQDIGTMLLLGTFSPFMIAHEDSVIKIRDDAPLDKAALLGCAIPTGWGSAVNAGDVRPTDTVVVIGVGGVGINAIQGARMAGAQRIIAVDPVKFKREKALEFGATHVSPSMRDAFSLVQELTWGRMAEKAIITVSVLTGDLLEEAMQLIGKKGTLVAAAVAPHQQTDVSLNLAMLNSYEKRIVGTLFGSCRPRVDIPRLLDYYMDGLLKIDELITSTYKLEQVNEAFADLHAGRNLRGLITFDSE